MRNRSTVSFIGLWELLHNPEFNCLEFEAIKKESGDNGFVMTPKRWIEVTGAVGIVSKQGRYAATYAHRDIAFEFASWISPEFKLYIIEDYQRLKNDENSRLSLNWNLNREIAKLNYRIHTDAIKNHLIPPKLTQEQISYKYANEADMLNVVLFGKTAKQWRHCRRLAQKDLVNFMNRISLFKTRIVIEDKVYLLAKDVRKALRYKSIDQLQSEHSEIVKHIKDLRIENNDLIIPTYDYDEDNHNKNYDHDPEYIPRLIAYQLEYEKMVKKSKKG